MRRWLKHAYRNRHYHCPCVDYYYCCNGGQMGCGSSSSWTGGAWQTHPHRPWTFYGIWIGWLPLSERWTRSSCWRTQSHRKPLLCPYTEDPELTHASRGRRRTVDLSRPGQYFCRPPDLSGLYVCLLLSHLHRCVRSLAACCDDHCHPRKTPWSSLPAPIWTVPSPTSPWGPSWPPLACWGCW